MLSKAKRELLQRRLRGEHVAARTRVTRPDRPIPLAYAQERLWFLAQLNPDAGEYNTSLPIPFDGPLDVPALADALTMLVERHEALRTRLVADEAGVPHQTIDAPSAFPLSTLDVSGQPDPRRAAHGLIADDWRRPFNLASEPLVRGLLVRLAPERHLLTLVMHHAVTDEWSNRIIRQELRTLYEARLAGRPSPLAPLSMQYADYAIWQRGTLTADTLESRLAYWRDLLADPPTLQLPIDRPRPPVRVPVGAVQRFTIPRAVAAGLRDLSRRSDATMFMTLLTAYGVLLHRHTGQDDLLVGTPIASRDKADTESIVGFLVNTLALRFTFDDDPTFTELLDRTRVQALESYAYQDAPFGLIVEELVRERDRSQPPLVQTFFNYYAHDPARYQRIGLVPEDEDGVGQVVDGMPVQWDIRLIFTESADDLDGVVEYCTAVFDHSTITRLIGHLRTLLAAIVTDPSRVVSQLPLLAPADQAQLDAWNDTSIDLPPGATILDLLEPHATDDTTAVIFANETLTYPQLHHHANQLAHRLRTAGPDAIVALHMDRGLDLIIAILATWKAGAAYLPLDPSHPADRIQHMIDDSGATVVLTDANTDDAPAQPRATVHPDQAAYVIYTSGTTGRPKGIVSTHRGLYNRITWMQRTYPLHPGDRVLHKTPTTFDVSVWELIWPLTVGATLVITEPGKHRDLNHLTTLMDRHRITTTHFVPSLFHEFVHHPWPNDLRHLKNMICSGEALAPADVATFYHRHPHATVHNLYGPTEASIDVTHHTCTRPGETTIPIGAPIANTTTHILDPHLNPVPIGAIGELHLAGTGLARGYLGQPALTATRFIPNPAGTRLYRTGDLARQTADGQIEYLGRTDHQIKIRGHRIEPGEIQTTLTQHPALTAAIVTAHNGRLVAYVVTAGNMPPVDELRAHLRGTLTEHQIPSIYIELTHLPMTTNGKLDRAALPAPDNSRPELSETYRAPRTTTEEILTAIFADLLDLDEVGTADNFFDLGGHSLLATQTITRIRTAFDIDLPLAALFDHPNVSTLAIVVNAATHVTAAPRATRDQPITPAPRNRPLPPSFAQQRLWFLDQLHPGSTAYNLPELVVFDGPVDAGRLADALTALVARHEVLRTRLVTGVDGIPLQMIDPPAPFRLSTRDMSDVEDSQRAIRAVMRDDAHVPFDLADGPLLRGTLLRLPEERWALTLCLHHAVFDEWSGRILRAELSTLYDGGSLPELPVQYADYATWQRQWLTGEVLDNQLRYWRDQLADPPVLQLPTDRPRTPTRGTVGAALHFTVWPEVATGLARLSRRNGTTLFMTLLAAYAVLLQRYTGQDDIVVGTPIANRGQAETEPLIGFFVNTLALRTRLDDDPTFIELLARTRATALAAYANQDLPFEQVVEELIHTRDRSQTPLIQTLFNFATNNDTRSVSSSGPRLQDDTVAKCDLALTITRDGAGDLSGALHYSTSLFEEPTARRLLDHWRMVLEGVVADPDRPVSRLSILTEGDRSLIADGNDTTVPVPDRWVPRLVADRAAERPGSVAVVCDDRVLTYGELDAAANRLAHHLRGLGTGPETVVGLCLDRGPDMIVSILAVWKAGAAYLPLDPTYPADRLAYMIQDSRAGLLIATADILDDLPAGRLRTLTLDDPMTAILVGGAPSEAPDVTVHAGQSAYVIYTSGSTGRPKGVVVGHRSMANLAVALGRLVEAGPGVTTLQFASMNFDASVWEIVMALTSGATLAVATADEQNDPDRLAAMLRARSVGVATLPPSLLRSLHTDQLATVRTLITAGERLDGRLAEEWAGHRRLVNAYGPTETTVCATAANVTPDEAPAPPIGDPIANVTVHVLDRHLTPVPAGATGELYVGGAGLARGYLRQPVLTASAFVPDPFAADGSRLYRTGDLVRRRPDGQTDYLGRTDQQVKVRGHRVEPSEIESALTAHPEIDAALVVAHGDRLVAYLVAGDDLPAVEDLRAHLRGSLPEHLVPSMFVELAELPVTRNGKIDRDALPAPDAERPQLTGGYRAPGTAIEEIIAGIWADLLRLDRVGITDDFFDLGGHSLLATQTVARIRAAFEIDLPTAALFDHPTVGALAATIDADAGTGVVSSPIVAVDRSVPLPLSFAQQRLWFLAELDPGSSEYAVPHLVRLDEPVPLDRVADALTALIARHEVLRTRLVTDERGRPSQVIDPPSLFTPETADVTGEADPRAALHASLVRDAQRPFDLAGGPLLRATLVQLPDDRQVLALVVHHVVFDDWSARIFERELAALCRGEPLPPLPVQYADYAAWQRDRLTGEVLDAQVRYWREQLADPPVLQLPTDRPRTPIRTADGATLRFTVPADVADGLRALSRRHGTTLFMTLLAAYAVLLQRHTGQDDIVVGSPIANRGQAETEPLIGLFVNTIALRTRLDDDPTFTELLGRTRATALAAYAHQDIPFEQLVDDLMRTRDRSQTPLVQTLFSFQTGGSGVDDAEPSLQRDTVAKVDLTLTVSDSGEGKLTGGLLFSTALFDESTIRRVLGHLWTLLDGIVADPDRPVSRLPVLTADEHRSLDCWNDTAVAVPAETVPDLIAARSGTRPDAVAVICAGHTMSYAELDAAANRLAHHLRAIGVGPDTVVALHMDRGIDVVVSVLAVWRAGGAYVPLDPRYPADRIGFMLADSGARVLIGHRPESARTVRVVSPDDPAIAGQPSYAPNIAFHPRQAAYVIYTSGSTGRPKGVVVDHGGLCTFATALRHHVRTGPDATTLQFASTSFDASVWEIVMALTAGATLAVATPDEQNHPELLGELLRRHGVSIALLPPSLLDSLPPDQLDTLSTLIAGGERLDDHTAHVWAAGRRLVNAYGPTETTVWGTVADITDTITGPAPIGHPIANARIHLLDRRLNLVPVGVAGEIFIAGPGVARGYLRRPALTGASFVPDPFAGDGSRMYRTGDLARRRADGELDYLGRTDQQVKVRGHRIEPAEIQHALTAYPGVNAAVVAVRDRRLVAYLVTEAGLPPVDELRTHLRRTLPDHMVPATFAEIAAIPLNPNGKTDLAALPEPDLARPEVNARYRAPSTDVERQLAGIWAEVLKLDQIGADDNFFELGGDSILSIQTVARARAAGLYFTAAQVFDHQTVAALSSVVAAESPADAEQGPVVGGFPFTPIQRWFFGRDLPEPAHFNQCVLLEPVDPVDPDALRRASDALLAHHDALRSRFYRDSLGLTAFVAPDEPETPLWIIDAAGMDDDALNAAATGAHTSLDLAHGPLARIVLLDFGTRQRLLFIVHHLAVDRVSWGILLEDLATAYKQAKRGARIQLPPKTTAFQRWSQRLTELAARPELREETGYWREVERAAKPLPRDYAGANTLASAATIAVALGAAQTERLLREVPAAHRTQINDVLLTALGSVLTGWTGEPAVLVDLEGHGREEVGADIDVSRTVGWFTTFHPVALSAATDPAEALRRTKDQLRAVPRHGLGHGLLRYLTPLMPPAGRPEIVFNYLGRSGSESDTRFRPVGGPVGTPRSTAGQRAHLLDISGTVQDGVLRLMWTYSRQVHDEATVRRLADGYVHALTELIDHCCGTTTAGFTPDFPLAGLAQDQLDRIRAQSSAPVQDIYPLTALQQGMLFHTQLEPHSGVYWVQSGLLLDGALDTAALHRAWEIVFARHEVLRSTVVWDGVPEPMSVVAASLPVPLERRDLSGLDPDAQRAAIADLLAADRQRGADFNAPSLVRILLIRLAPRRHQMVLSFHHLVLDGWSSPIVVADLVEAYGAVRSGRRPPSPDRRPFRDHVAWVRAQDPSAAETYWRARLAGLSAPTPLRVERTTGSHGQRVQRARLSTAATRRLSETARRHQLTMNTVVQGAWAALMSVYAGTDDVLFGVTTSGRGDQFPGVESVVGLLINTIPARVAVDRDEPVADWLRRLQREHAESRTFEHTPLVDIRAWSEMPPGAPLFDTVLIFENYPTVAPGPNSDRSASGQNSGSERDDGDLRLERVFAREQANYPLLIVVAAGAELAISLVHDSARLAEDTVSRMVEQLIALLDAIAKAPDHPVAALPWVTAAERDLLTRWEHTPALTPETPGVHQAVAARAAERPHATAVVSGDVELTYLELDQRANRLAHRLRGLGVGPERIVALCLDRGADMVIAMLGVLKAGGAYLPLDTGYPVERLRFMLTDSGAAVLIGGVPGLGPVERQLELDGAAGTAPGPLDLPVRPGQAAYVVYTSGSTGAPKGVVVTHHNLAVVIAAQRHDLDLRADDTGLQMASYSFDVAASEIFTVLTAGARLVIADAQTRRSPDGLQQLLRSQAVTTAQIAAPGLPLLGTGPLPELRSLLVGGEACPPDLARQYAGGRRFLNAYGPTETTICATIAIDPDTDDGPLTIGRPTAGSRIHILDEHLRQVPIGVPGELYTGGDGVSRGYLGRPALTAARFVPHTGGTRLYRTGDLARWRPDGGLDFLGRTDRQLKVRGHRIEPGEVEAALTAHPGIAGALVTIHDGRLVGYLVPSADDDPPPADDLRAHLGRTLPESMIPSVFVKLSALPLNPNGKLDIAALPAPGADRPDLAACYRAPATPTEELLAGIWADVLGLDRVGVADDFFDLGGHSLLAIRTISRIRAVVGTELPLAALFDYPTVAALAVQVDNAGRSEAPPITPVDRSRPLPLSYSQQRLWFLAQLEPHSTEFNIPDRIPLHGDVDRDTVAHALTAVVERHEILRTRITTDANGEPHQVIDPPAPVDLRHVDLTDGRGSAPRTLSEQDRTPFDLATGPLLRATLLTLSPTHHVLALTLHHIVSDEWSAAILHEDLSTVYGGGKLPALPVQYADYAAWQRQQLTGTVHAGQLDYWHTQLADPPVLRLPTDRPHPPARSTTGATWHLTVPAEIATRLRELSRCNGTTMFMTLSTAYAVLLHRLTGQDDLLIGTPVANRAQPETERLIGFFVNTLALRSRFDDDPTFTELLARTRTTALGAYAHQDIPFEHLVDELVGDRDRSRTPLIQTLFTYADRGIGVPDRPDASRDVHFDLALSMGPHGDGLAGVFEYSIALFDDSTVERIAAEMLVLLEAVTQDPGVRVSELPLLTDSDKHQLAAWNDTALPLTGATGADALITAQAEQHPHDIAVESDGETLTYADLNIRANHVAHHLHANGVGPETVVGLQLPRGLDIVIAILAVWKAGGAYLPLDPSYPAERLDHMRTDSGAILTLTSIPTGTSDNPPPPSTTDQRLAAVIYTSGSTGQPKATLITHTNLTALQEAWSHSHFTETDRYRWLSLTNISFDVFTGDLIRALGTGGTLIIAPAGLQTSTDDFHHFLHHHHIEALESAPRYLDQLDQPLPDLKLVIATTDTWHTHTATRLQQLLPQARVLTAYGITETTIDTTYSTLPPGPDGPTPIGTPLPNNQTHILDPHLHPTPIGVTGELFIGGAGVTRGYHNKPALTAQRFIPGPEGTRLYRTGDLARQHSNGQTYFLGRNDHQIKLHGHRIEPTEIEHTLTTHPKITTAVVTVHDDRLIAYLIGDIPPTDELRTHLRTTLPNHLIPSTYIELTALPLTPNGKLDHTALPTPDNTRPDLTATYQAPTTPTEEIIAGIWQELLNLDRIGVTDNFFDLGGHSLLAMRAVTRIRTTFNTQLPLATLFDQPTIRRLAATVETTEKTLSVPPIVPADRSHPLPLSFAQQRLWFLAQLNPESTEYNNPSVFRLGVDVDVAALTGALSALVDRHEILRTRLVSGPDGVPHQVIDPAEPFALELADVSGEDDPHAAAQRLLDETARAPFDLRATHPLRGRLIRASGGAHLLALCLHHVAVDEWSAAVFERELFALYQGLTLAPLAVQYADYAVWQREWLCGPVLAGQLDYWRTELADPPVLSLPTDRQRPPVRSAAGAVVGFTVPDPVASGLRELSARQGATMFMTTIAAYATLLARYTGQDDVLVGTPIANRNHPDTEGLIGFFVNTLVLRTRFGDDPTFAELLDRTRSTALGAYAHQDLPFDQLVDELVHDRDRSRTPLVQVLFNYFNVAEPVRSEVLDRDDVVAKFDLRLMLAETADGLIGGFEYATALFDRSRIERLVGHLQTLLEAITLNPDQPVSQLPLLTEAEWEALTSWNATTTPPPDIHAIHHLITHHDKPAIISPDTTLTYTQLHHRANQLAHHLHAQGVQPETVVAICLDNATDTLIAILAIWKAGAAYLPLDPTHPAERLTYQLRDSHAALLITTDDILNDLPAGHLRTLTPTNPVIATYPGTAPDVPIHPDQAAYVIYTSGSTGGPKGVIATHRGLTNYATTIPSQLGTGPGSYGLLQPATTDFGNTTILAALTTGGTLHLADPTTITDADHMATFLEHIDYLKIVPSHLANLWHTRPVLPRKTLILGGETTPTNLAAQLANSPISVVNHYGPTETTIGATTHTGHFTGNTIGTPIANTQTHILDRHLRPVPVGVNGELYIGGTGVTRGYLRKPALTATQFIPADDGQRLYRTGDQVTRNTDGTIQYLGRTDHQVKIRGHRIEPGEIQHALTKHPAITAAIVTTHRDKLVAYLVTDGHQPPVNDIRAHLANTLPEHMIPATYIKIDTIPLTTNGKLDHTALPQPDHTRPELTDRYKTPTTPTEEILATIWQNLLDLDQVGTDDNFFDLGGHSLLATQAISRIRVALSADVALSVLFDNPTIAALAAEVDLAARASLAPIARADRDERLPLSYAQQRLWFLAQLEPDSTEYHVPARIPLRGVLHLDALERALNTIVERHEILRTRYLTAPDGTPRQAIDPPEPVDLPHVDLSADPHPHETAHGFLAQQDRTPFCLATGPLVRATLITLNPSYHVLALTFHHIVSDEWSATLFLHELTTLYCGNTLPPLPVQYADYAAWQRQQLAGTIRTGQLDYWRTQLADPPVLRLPTDRPHPPTRITTGATQHLTVPADVTANLKDLARRHTVTMFMLLEAAYATFLHRHTGQDDLLIGTPVANRAHPDTEHLIGFFVNTLALRTRFDDDPTFSEVLAQTRETALAAYSHQDLPFEEVVGELVHDRNRSRTPLIQTLFAFGTGTRAAVPSDDMSTEEHVPFDLSLSMAETTDGLAAVFEYSTVLFDHTTVRRMGERLQRLLDAIVRDADAPVSELPVLAGPDETDLAAWNDTALPLTGATGADALITAQAEQHPHDIAVESDGETLTYADLNIRANHVAHHLHANGVGPETVVGLQLPRGLDIVIAILAVWKAGGAYLPLDPSYPAERLDHMRTDSGAILTLTSIPTGTSDNPPPPSTTDQRLAAVIYTSGSTGQPKATLITHTNLTALQEAWSHSHFTETDRYRWLSLTNISFDVFTGDLIRALGTGGTLIIAPAGLQTSTDDFHHFLHHHHIEALESAPRYLDQLDQPLPDLKLVIATTDTWHTHTATRLQQLLPQARVLTAYGITETTIDTTYSTLPPGPDGPTPIGTPLPNNQTHILDPHLHPTPIGVTGELFIGGAGVTRGYHNKPALTAQRFIPGPEGTRLYRTGDLARQHSNGQTYFLGRNDHQIKLHGHRIEPTEIEHTLTTHPKITTAVVTVHDDRLIAYLIGDIPPTDELRTHLRTTLPNHLIPSTYIELTALPLTPNGKLDHTALPTPDNTRPDLTATYQAPTTPTEEIIAGIWQELLNLDRIGVTDNFFDLGGHSLLAMRAVTRIRTTFNTQLPLATLFDQPTIRRLAATVTQTLIGAEEYEEYEF